MLLTEMSLRETDCCALKHIKKIFNKTFKEYPHDHLEGGGPHSAMFKCGGLRYSSTLSKFSCPCADTAVILESQKTMFDPQNFQADPLG